MPRIFAPNENYTSTQNYLNFTNGAAAVASTDAGAIAYFTAELCDIDTSKHALTVLDTLPRATLNSIATYLGITLDPTDGKYEVIRDIEGLISTHLLTPLTVTSVAHADTVGNTVLTVASGGVGGAANGYYYKAAAVAPAPLYGDQADATWTLMTTGAAAGVPLTTGENVTVVEAVKATGFIFASGSDEVASKAGD